MRCSTCGVVLENRNRIRQVGGDQIQITIPVQITGRRAVAHGVFIEAPIRRNVGKLKPGLTTKCQIFLPAFWCIPVEFPLRPAHHFAWVHQNIRVAEIPGGPGGHHHIRAPVEIEIPEFHRPSPVRPRHPGLESDFLEEAGSGIDVEHVAHGLARPCIFKDPAAVAGHLAHGGFGFEMRGPRHIRYHKVEPPITIKIAEIAAHGREGGIRQIIGHSIVETEVPVIDPQAVGVGVVIGDINVRPPVAIHIQDKDGQAMPRRFPDAAVAGDILESRDAFFVRTIIPVDPVRMAVFQEERRRLFARIGRFTVGGFLLDHTEIGRELWQDAVLSVRSNLGSSTRRPALRVEKPVRHQE